MERSIERSNESVQYPYGRKRGGRLIQSPASAAIALPLVSIIVVVFRAREELCVLIEHLASFRSDEVELIIIDGGSDDGSAEILEEKTDQIDFWLSEPDNGIYDAMNKGIAASRGVFILHINEGDRLLTLPLVELRELAEASVDVVCCRVLEDGHHTFLPRNDWLLRFDNTWHHQGTFYRRSKHLSYKTGYKVFGDFDHNQRLRRTGGKAAILELLLATHCTDGLSSSARARSEIYRSIRDNFGALHLIPAYLRFSALKLRRWMRGTPKR